jgi:cysteine desulfurase
MGAPIYFDHNATTRISARSLAAMNDLLQSGPCNPSSKHSLGERAQQRVRAARAQVAALLGATPAELVFTSGGTEANHLAILGALAARPERNHIISSDVEHPSTLQLLRSLRARGVRVSLLPVDGAGRLNLAALADTLTPDTALVSLMWANNETGVVFPVAAAAELAHASGAWLHTDAVQAVGRLPIDLRQVPVDLLSLSGHKLHAPAGIGALFVRKGLQLVPQQSGHQERGRRGGTENVAGIVALGAACEETAALLATEPARIARLRDHLENALLQQIAGADINGLAAERIGNTTSVRFGSIPADFLLTHLDRHGICASSGAACASAEQKPSHVLKAMGLDDAAALASLRFSLGRDNTEAEIDALLRVLPGLLQALAPDAGPVFVRSGQSAMRCA